MNCQKCGGKGDVKDSRPQGEDVWRRRQCRACGDTWITVELRNPSDIDLVFRNLKALTRRGGAG